MRLFSTGGSPPYTPDDAYPTNDNERVSCYTHTDRNIC
jgi:hypothetical protein